MTVPYWDFTGTTMVTNQYVRLTQNQQSRQGGLWNSVVSHLVLSAWVVPSLRLIETRTIFS